jgi:hypothetical protein
MVRDMKGMTISQLAVSAFLFATMIVFSGVVSDLAKNHQWIDLLQKLPLILFFAVISFFASKFIKWNKSKQ